MQCLAIRAADRSTGEHEGLEVAPCRKTLVAVKYCHYVTIQYQLTRENLA